MAKKYYVVWKGSSPGVYDSWKECQKQIKAFEGAQYKSFPTQKQAESAFMGSYFEYVGKDQKKGSLSNSEKASYGKPIYDSISVDAACSGNPVILEYKGVYTKNAQELFHLGPFPEGTVNIGEFLALVHGLAYLKKNNNKLPVYSDSKTAMVWVKNKKIKTTLVRKPKNEKLFELVDRALKWLHENTYDTKIIKWETKAWGEIPADFGRK